MLKHNLRILIMATLSLALVSCSSNPPQTSSSNARISGPVNYKQSHKDGAPWWDVDVSKIPDAVPMPHAGNFKAAPYTVLGKRYYPIQEARHYRATGTASWYGTKFHGKDTANGEVFDLYGMTAAHKTLPLPSYVKVTNLENGRSVTLRVNDRGPFYSDRIIDLSFAAAQKLGYAEKGVARVSVEGIDPYEWWAQRGQPVPEHGISNTVLAQQKQTVELHQPERYTPPTQHVAAVNPRQVESEAPMAQGLYLQVGAFANPDAAQLLRDKLSALTTAPVFINSVVRDQQVLHRVRMGPVPSQNEAEHLQDRVRLANLGWPALVSTD
ncbi:septal ring lytic transglycosylase RlpA family protein [Denitrificimonas sp. JX-1]|uniref:Endolytic peptidoglycan transglycosylase RlpA n=1 Tax=Denitrificimonas halotolerans TaxID=3098930 RepID=A0ABU5GTE0_9GAMM|nr:septal ring lytic transglycosylase RlpA family protein [Denitrificimonas sp. JX-1]MDY7219970.1 septal ring lytic transglycosylase RlpA family protein [Denitrificimonas sp. JX-1]